MLKRFFLSLALAAGLLSPSYGAGTIPFSLSQQLDQFGKPLAACQFYSIQAGTTSTPQNAFQDSALTIPLPNPQTCDAAGRLPQMFFADGSIKIRLTDRNGVNVITADNVQVIGNSSGGGGGSPVDPTTILTTGDIKATYGTGAMVGFVRANGRTIGSASSGASERANADTQALFQYLWQTDPNLVVPSGRGASANADWIANKQLTLPDWRSRALAGLSDMGNVDSARLTPNFFGQTSVGACLSTTLGCAGGSEFHFLSAGETPSIASAGSAAVSGTISPSSGGNFVVLPAGANMQAGATGNVSGGSLFAFFSSAQPAISGINASLTGSSSVASTNTGGNAHPIASPMMLTTIYLKL